ncbi:hypothetical protein Scep_024561 [Stephania cephalantha]|uniref:Uncharacterized protein n=1 Tax=Stephania cephalantha TaxID=152367 RepID=A0AAP0HYD7_9MAGN
MGNLTIWGMPPRPSRGAFADGADGNGGCFEEAAGDLHFTFDALGGAPMASWDPPNGVGNAVEVGICVVEVGLVDDDGEIMSRPRSDDRAPEMMGPVRPSRSDPLSLDAARPLPDWPRPLDSPLPRALRSASSTTSYRR